MAHYICICCTGGVFQVSYLGGCPRLLPGSLPLWSWAVHQIFHILRFPYKGKPGAHLHCSYSKQVCHCMAGRSIFGKVVAFVTRYAQRILRGTRIEEKQSHFFSDSWVNYSNVKMEHASWHKFIQRSHHHQTGQEKGGNSASISYKRGISSLRHDFPTPLQHPEGLQGVHLAHRQSTKQWADRWMQMEEHWEQSTTITVQQKSSRFLLHWWWRSAYRGIFPTVRHRLENHR